MIPPVLSRAFLRLACCAPRPPYSLLKLLKPQQGDWKLQVKGVSKDKIDINLVFNYDLELAMDPPPSSKVKAGDTIDINAYLVSNGQKLQDQEQYGNMTAKLLIKDLDTGDESEVELENKEGSFVGLQDSAEA